MDLVRDDYLERYTDLEREGSPKKGTTIPKKGTNSSNLLVHPGLVELEQALDSLAQVL